jgi:type I restriction enzyme S subunit
MPLPFNLHPSTFILTMTPPGYKQTEVGVIPEAWEVKPLSELASLYQPITISAKQFKEAGYPVYGANGVVGFYHSANHHTWQVTVTCRGSTCGTVNRTVDECWITGNAMVLNCDQNKSLSKDFFYYLLLGQNLSDCITGTGQPQIVRSPIAAFRVAVPPSLPEQRAIATALSDVDALLAALDRLIAKQRDLKQAAMQQLLTGQTRLPGFKGQWEDTTLGEIGQCIIGLTYKPENVVEHGLLVLRSSNVQNGRLAYNDNVHVNLKVADHLYTRLGDILVCVRNGSRALIGKCAVIDDTAAGVTFGAFMSVYRTKHWRFIIHAFQSGDIQRQIRDNIGATINQITNKDMKAFRVKLPPEDEQTAIATVLSDMDLELAALEQRRDKTRALKQGMMQELLTGRTRLI